MDTQRKAEPSSGGLGGLLALTTGLFAFTYMTLSAQHYQITKLELALMQPTQAVESAETIARAYDETPAFSLFTAAGPFIYGPGNAAKDYLKEQRLGQESLNQRIL